MESKKDSVRVDTSVVSGMRVTIVQSRHQKPLHPLSHQHKEVEVHRGKKEPQRQESVWEDHSTAVRKLLERYLHRRVRLTRAALRQANIRKNKGPSLNKTQVELPHERSLYAVKLEDRSLEETERQERCAPRRCAATRQEYLQAQRKGQIYILFAYR